MNLQRYDNNGLELIIDNTTGESFASISGYARMSNASKSTIFERLNTVFYNEIKTAEISTTSGLKTVRLISENLIAEWLPRDNPKLASQMMKLGIRLFLHNLAGYNVKSEAVNEFKTPTTYLEALKALVSSEESKLLLETKNKELTEKIIEDTPKVEFAEQVAASDDCISIGDFAKVLDIKGLGRNRLYTKLRDLNILRVNNTPYQKFIDRGYFEVIETVTPIGIRFTTKVTGKGQIWLTKKLT
jgi:phage antirepressor YoqD-like protein